MSPEELNSALKRRPFMPFRIHVTGNVQYEIRNPEMVMIGRTIIHIGLRRDIDSPFFDEPVWVSLRHVTHVEPIVEAEQPAS
jgi:hypothetical protein